ncbi:hypothetical protein B7H01_08190 [Pandoraea apista]|nr:hypothetical protein B7H01_08190 [Pandoraea apista]RRW97774.1 hypothetical protein EGJ54_06085 [Pandoraea apista]
MILLSTGQAALRAANMTRPLVCQTGIPRQSNTGVGMRMKFTRHAYPQSTHRTPKRPAQQSCHQFVTIFAPILPSLVA